MDCFLKLAFFVKFQVIAAMNPCPCGHFGDLQKACTCAPAVVTKYQKRISGPLLDRIDIHIEVSRVDYEKLSGIGWERRRNPFEPEYKLHAIFNLSVFQIPNHRILWQMPTWRRGDTAIFQVTG